jgi:hypothetical protein
LAAEFGLESCEVKGRAKQFCVPADKTVTAIEDGSVLPLDGNELVFSRLCYKLKCSNTVVPPQQITDQFGSRTIDKFKAFQLCTPAVLDAVVTTTTSTTTTTTMADVFSDTFDGPGLDPSWSILNPSQVTIDVSGGALNLEPTMTGAGNTWFDDSESGLVYKSVTGDFDISAILATEDSASPGDPPPTQYRLAGILARDPAGVPGSRNSVHVALGAGSTIQGTSYEYKSTDESVSTWATTPTASPVGEVRLTRVGSTFEMFWRPDAVSLWTSIQSFGRPDLPATLQVGMMVYANEAPASIRASFDEIVFN